jgi:hypothetical protein
MKKHVLVSSLLMAAVMLMGVRTASAIILEFSPSGIDTTGLQTGDTLSLDVTISGLETGGFDEIVSAFDFDVLYDASQVDATIVTFNTTSLFPSLGFGQTAVDTSTAGVVGVGAVAFEDDAILAFSQGDSFKLFTIDFKVLTSDLLSMPTFDLAGVSTLLGLNGVVGRNAQFLPLENVQVPEPSAFLLMTLGLTALGFLRRRRV